MNDEQDGLGLSIEFLLGVAVGAGVALLFAPAPGRETRRQIGSTARRVGAEALDTASALTSTAVDTVSTLKSSATEKVEELKGAVTEAAQTVAAAVQEGRDTYHREMHTTPTYSSGV